MRSKLFCCHPFDYLEVTPEGRCFLCCPAWLPTPVGSLASQNLEQVWNSPTAKEIRMAMLQGRFTFCKSESCGWIQGRRLPSRESVAVLPEFADLFAKHATELSAGPRTLNLGYDRTCNLKCRSCRDHYIGLSGSDLDAGRELQRKLFAHPWIKDVTRLFVTGHGDPFASQLYRELLTEVIDAEAYPRMRIRIMTNGLLLTPAMWERMKKLHSLIETVSISVDAATPETYRLLRGAEFSVLLKNLAFLGDLRRSGCLKRLEINFLVQRDNFREMKAFVDLGREHNCSCVTFSRLENRDTFSESEYREHAVYREGHPDFRELLRLLSSTCFDAPGVNLSNLSGLRLQSRKGSWQRLRRMLGATS